MEQSTKKDVKAREATQKPARIHLIATTRSTSVISKGTVPCLHCGGLQISSHANCLPPQPPRNQVGSNKADANKIEKKVHHNAHPSTTNQPNQEHLVAGLLQQIKLMELEISFLKNHTPKVTTGNEPRQNSSLIEEPNGLVPGSSNHLRDENSRLQSEIKKLRQDLAQRNASLEEALMASASEKRHRANSRLGQEEQEEDKSRLLDSIARLTGLNEQLETDRKNLEDRLQSTLEELERQSIVSKDREKRICALLDDLESKDETQENMRMETEALRLDVVQRQNQYNDLHDKFLQSSQHILEETLRGFKDENRNLQQKLKILEVKDEEYAERQTMVQTKHDKLLIENAELRAEFAEVRQKLESEVRARESRDAKFLLDSQEASSGKEKEKALKQELNRLQTEVEREKAKIKTFQDKSVREAQQITSLELRVSTQKSRIAELEGSLVLAQESTNKIRKESLVHQDKISRLLREIDNKGQDLKALASKLTASENRLRESERRVETMSSLHSQRWMEFSKMADSMKELSTNMLQRSKSNTKVPAIEDDVDDGLDY
ncbi:trichohyalin-like isoform X2 [Tigriopus californicus]|uniref:trichohyalin-like isoform X2 n=1 Tax=Tigriopus californicus TaxID=6832 RepID=UPI0027DAA2D3|nr:trichohyalin-like isoform X2 [Tigriopus californicus]